MHNDKTDLEQQFGERVVAIETDLNSFKEEVRGELRGLSSSVSKLAEVIQRSGRPNWQVWIGMAGLIFALVGSGVVFVDMRISGKFDPLSTSMAKSLSEVETQFNADAQLRNVQWSEQQRMNALLWNSGPLGKVAQYPSAPFYQPNVLQKGQSE